MSIETSIVVDFGDDVVGSSDTIVIELDPDNPNNLDSKGELKSTFAPGEQPVFILNHANTVVIDRVASTDGYIFETGGTRIVEKEQTTLFTSVESESSLSYANVDGITSEVWYGNTAVIDLLDSALTTSSGNYPALTKIEYNVPFQKQYQLIPPNLSLGADESYEIIIVIYASVRT